MFNLLIKEFGLKICGILLGVSLAWYGINYVQKVFQKAKQYDVINAENATLKAEKKTLTDSLKLHKEWLAKSLIDTRNATELHAITKSMTTSFQSVVSIMRDSVIKINQDRVLLHAKNIELEKEVEKLKKKRRIF